MVNTALPVPRQIRVDFRLRKTNPDHRAVDHTNFRRVELWGGVKVTFNRDLVSFEYMEITPCILSEELCPDDEE